MRIRSMFCLSVIVIGQIPYASGATTTSVSVSAQIIGGCTINGAVPASGGAVGSFGTLDFGSAISLSCTPGITVMMSLDDGQHPLNGSRAMMRNGGTERVTYSLYRDSSYSIALLPGTPFTLDTSHSPAPLNFPVYGRATPDGTTPPGQYSDIVTVTIQW
ncbi:MULTISPECIES: Csu type fimbrial protein [Asaia]|uniref:Csu type fimbrial protein n=1 Tax=Asaia TaxID=91914 RepID=UPI00255212AD|nr:spore coat U domain-containing protein [Asaia sp. HumB]MDL2171635.1 spore coat U domain-containing protein [Asaia sp. HumB]